MRKMRIRAGETLLETLLSIFILSMGMLLLSGAVLSAARVNARAERMLNPVPATPMEFAEPDLSHTFRVELQNAEGTIIAEIPVNAREESNGDFFYETALGE